MESKKKKSTRKQSAFAAFLGLSDLDEISEVILIYGLADQIRRACDVALREKNIEWPDRLLSGELPDAETMGNHLPSKVYTAILTVAGEDKREYEKEYGKRKKKCDPHKPGVMEPTLDWFHDPLLSRISAAFVYIRLKLQSPSIS